MANVFTKKKRMTEKMIALSKEYRKSHSHGMHPKGFILNYSNKCNFTCPHCYTKSGAGEFGTTTLSIEDVKRLADEADELGVYEIDIQGGEPLLNPDLFKILEALGPDRFYIYITTNGWLLDEEMAYKLAAAGVDRVSVSIDAFTAEEHDGFRKKEGSFERCLKALEYTQKAGMKAYVNIVVGHYNAQSQELRDFVEFLDSNNWGIVFNCASPSGNWKGKYEVMLTPEDSKELERLKNEHKDIIRDLWNYFNPGDELVYGCPAVNLFYVNPTGDILPCPYIHTKIGNIKEESLKDILNRGFSIKKFREYSPKCLVGEDREFAEKYLNNSEMSILNPIPYDKLFSKEDIVPDNNRVENLEDFTAQLKKMPITAAFSDQIRILKERYSDEYIGVAEDIIRVFNKLDLDVVKTSRKYIFDYLKQLDYFLKNKNYGHSNFEEIREGIYDNEKTMLETYMPGLLLSYAYTTILYEKNHIYLTEFLSRIKGGMHGIEVGFGEGFYIWELLKHIPDVCVTGYDISQHAIKFATGLLEAENIDADCYELKYGNVFEGLGQEDGTADFATIAEVIEHIPHPEAGIKEVVRILKPNGLLYLTTVMNSNHMDHISNFQSVEEVEKLIENEGMEIIVKNIYHMTDDFPNSNDVSVGMAFVARKK